MRLVFVSKRVERSNLIIPLNTYGHGMAYTRVKRIAVQDLPMRVYGCV